MGGETRFTIDDRPLPVAGSEPLARVSAIDGGYAAAMGIAVKAGRPFAAQDHPRSVPVAMVHEASSLSDKERDRVLSTCRFHSAALVLPPWRAIYVTDTERDQTFQDAQRIDARIRTCYREAGFSLLDVPSLPVQERAVFVLRSLGIADI